MENVSKHLLGIVWGICVVVAMASGKAAADGMAFDTSSFRPLAPNEQRAAIAYRDGVERLVIAIDLERAVLAEQDQAGKVVWIFPVPGTVEKIKLDLVDTFPLFGGVEIGSIAKRNWELALVATGTTVLLPAVVAPYYMSYGAAVPRFQGYSVDRWGIHAEAVRVESVDELAEHLRKNEAVVDDNRLRVFAPYVGTNHVLVIAWIASAKEALAKFPLAPDTSRHHPGTRPSLYVEFPTDRVFYPLMATGGYDEEKIRVTIYCLDFVRPDLSKLRESRDRDTDSKHSNWLWVDYYVNSSPSKLRETAPKGFLEGRPLEAADYTRVQINFTARNLTDDLWFTTRRPTRILLLTIFNAVGWIPVAVCLIVLLSYVSAGLTGWFMFDSWRGSARMGLWNFLTLIGLIAAMTIKGRRTGRDRRTFRFAILFSIFYIMLVIGVFLVGSGVLGWMGAIRL